IDKDLLVPLRSSPNAVKSLRIDEPIAPSTFSFTPPKGYREVSGPVTSPDPSTVLDNVRRNSGDWQTLQYVTKLDNSWSVLPGIALAASKTDHGPVFTATAAIEKPDKVRFSLKGTHGERFTVVFQGGAGWIVDYQRKRYMKLSDVPAPIMNLIPFVFLAE